MFHVHAMGNIVSGVEFVINIWIFKKLWEVVFFFFFFFFFFEFLV
jgi:hypothetical protein